MSDMVFFPQYPVQGLKWGEKMNMTDSQCSRDLCLPFHDRGMSFESGCPSRYYILKYILEKFNCVK